MELLRYLTERDIQVGARIPDFILVDQNNNTVRLRDLAGSPAVLYFYPKDGSEGCTVEACEFRDVYDDFKELDCPVYGISPDGLELSLKHISEPTRQAEMEYGGVCL